MFGRNGAILLIQLLSLWCGPVAFAQSGRIISTKDGLPQSFVSGLEQDNAGFMWIATRNGLARYDGRHFKVFQHLDEDSAAIASNLIISIQKKKGKIWLEYESGEIDRFDPESEEVHHFIRQKILQDGSFLRRAWLIDANERFWTIHEEKGLVAYDSKTRKTTRYNVGSNLGNGKLWGLTETSDGHIWVLSDRGVSRITVSSGRIDSYQTPVPVNYSDPDLSLRFSVALHQRDNGELMWGDRRQLYFFSWATRQFRIIPMPGESLRGIVWIRTGPDGSEYFERDGALCRYHDKTGFVQLHAKVGGDESPLQSFLIDRSGLVWMGTNAYGIRQLDLTTPFFPAYPIRDGFAGDVIQKLFGGSLAGLFDWREADDRFSAPGYHLRSAYDKKGGLYIGLKETIVHYDAKEKRLVRLPKIPYITRASGPGVGVKGLAFTTEGHPVVVGYNGNVLSFDRSQGKWGWVLPKDFISSRLGENLSPRDIHIDLDRLWITTEMDGLLMVDLKTHRISQLKHSAEKGALPTDQLLGFCPDPTRPDLLWIGSYNGLICLNKKTLVAEKFGPGQGLPDQTVYSLLPDRSGHLWFGTNKGLCRFNPVTHSIKVFQIRHGLPENEFNRFHQLLLPDGRMAFGGTEGWTVFDPLAIKDDLFEPAVAFTGLKINNAEAAPQKSGILTSPLNVIPELVLPYDQNTLQFTFAGLQFNQPEDLSYRYQLESYDKSWVEAGNNPLAAYTKIPPGHYLLKVNAGNTSGQWSRHIKTLKIKVRPPWWATWWAYILYTLATSAAIWYWLRLQLTRLELRKSVELKQQEARQLQKLSEMKSRFFTNITHDFRTPLTMILSPLPGIIQEQTSETQKRKLSSVKKNAEQLLTLINQLLDFSKAETGMLSVNESRGELSLFVENTVGLFREEAIRKDIALLFDSRVNGDFWFDAPKLERMLGNLIGNAIKFTRQGGKVSVLLEKETHGVLISVSDTGIGIPTESLPHIFERYYQAGTGGSQGQEPQGSGIGLALVKELAILQNGTIHAESIPGKGSTVRLRLPLQGAESGRHTEAGPKALNSDFKIRALDEEEVVILLVEDNYELADFVANSLPDHYQIMHAANGAEGFQLALENIPDLIISDVMMPVMDGLELCRQVKQHEHTRHIPLILLTAKISVDSRMEGLELGADDYLTKPFHVPELNLRVYNLLERERRLRQRLKEELLQPKEGEPEPGLTSGDPFLTRLFEMVEAHLDEPEMGITALSERMSLSRSQLHRKVRAVSGLAVSELVRNYRLTRAAGFLREGFTSSESAYKAGFDSPAYFTKCFHAFYGRTPSEYSRQG